MQLQLIRIFYHVNLFPIHKISNPYLTHRNNSLVCNSLVQELHLRHFYWSSLWIWGRCLVQIVGVQMSQQDVLLKECSPCINDNLIWVSICSGILMLGSLSLWSSWATNWENSLLEARLVKWIRWCSCAWWAQYEQLPPNCWFLG